MLAWAYPDRVARRRGNDGHRYLLANGRGVVLREHDPLSVSDWLVVAHLDALHGDGRVFLAATVDIDTLREELGGRIDDHEVVAWDSREQAVIMRHEERLGALRLSLRACTDAAPERVVAAMLDGIRDIGLAALPWTREARELQTRVINARAWGRSRDWPDLSDEHLSISLEQWLGPYLDGISRRSHLVRLDLEQILRSQLDWQAQQALERLLPTHWAVPSGSRIRLEYRIDEPPVLAVRLQEMFGCTETPTVCDNAVPVVVHLLSPARRPIQVTSDLRGFWQRTYREVKKELKGRYPKHYWPDDPTTAVATSRVRPGQTNRK
jgi:ATP-dependent helicase HrpB